MRSLTRSGECRPGVDERCIYSGEITRVMWSVSDVAWETVRSNEQPLVSLIVFSLDLAHKLSGKLAMGKLVNNNDEKPKDTFTWTLLPVGEPNVSGKIKPGLYSLQNKASETFVMMGPDEKTIGCWPASDFKDKITKLVSVTAPWIRFNESLMHLW